MSNQIQIPNPCWCCGQECMFCYPDDVCKPSDGSSPRHWCAECKYIGCEYCCGCKECQKLGRAGWSSRGLALEERIPHIRGKDRKCRRAR
jgi:hypothetical protein